MRLLWQDSRTSVQYIEERKITHNIVHGSNNQYTILYTILHRNSIQKSHYNNQYMSTYGNKCLRWLCSILVYTVGGCYCLRVDMSWSVIRWRSNRCTRTTRGATRASPRMCSVRRGLTSPSLSPVCALYIGFIYTMQSKKHPLYLSSSSSGGTLEEHSRFHDASPGRTIRCSP